MICLVCKGESETSRVYPTMGATASYSSGGYYDEAGEWVPVTWRVVDSQGYRCSRGHTWSVDTERPERAPVPAFDPSWSTPETEPSA